MIKIDKEKWLLRGLLVALLVIVMGTFGILRHSMHPYNKLRTEAQLLAAKNAKVNQFDGFWWNTRDKSYVTLSGTRKNQPVYVVIARKTGHMNVVLQKRGTTRNTVLRHVWQHYKPKRVLNAGMRLDKKRLVWDVGFVAQNGTLGYASYDYRSGQLIKVIHDL